MKIHKYQAALLLPIHKDPIPGGIIHADENGKILNILDSSYRCDETIYFDGILSPGFVNTHTHTELSGMGGLIEKKTGLDGFIEKVEKLKYSSNPVPDTIEKAIQAMYKSGTVAACDISNTSLSLSAKKKSHLLWHTFVEIYGSNPAKASEKFMEGVDILSTFKTKLPQHSSSLSAHATYSLSSELFKRITQYTIEHGGPLSLHFAESPDEINLFINNEGRIAQRLKLWGIPENYLPFSGQRPIQCLEGLLPSSERILFVHNTLANKDDLWYIGNRYQDAWYCLCPESNLYIEGILPELSIFKEISDRVCLGTDSLASSGSLSIAKQIYILMREEDGPCLSEAFRWASLNGARFMGLEKTLGSFESGKSPGILYIRGYDVKNHYWNEEPKVERII